MIQFVVEGRFCRIPNRDDLRVLSGSCHILRGLRRILSKFFYILSGLIGFLSHPQRVLQRPERIEWVPSRPEQVERAVPHPERVQTPVSSDARLMLP